MHSLRRRSRWTTPVSTDALVIVLTVGAVGFLATLALALCIAASLTDRADEREYHERTSSVLGMSDY